MEGFGRGMSKFKDRVNSLRRIYLELCGFSLPMEGEGFSLPPGAWVQSNELHVAHVLLMV